MILGAGEALVDLVPGPVPGGAPLNAVVAAKRMGVDCSFLGRLSTDVEGETLFEYLLENEIDVDFVQRGPEPTPKVHVETSPRVRYWIDDDKTAEAFLEPLPEGTRLPERAILHSGALAMFRGQTATTMLQTVEAHAGLVSVDPNVRPQLIPDREAWLRIHQSWLPYIDIYKVSDEDFEWIWPERTIKSVVDELLKLGVSVVLITNGAEGVSLYSDRGEIVQPGIEVKVVDTVGAGDTFIGSFLASIVQADALSQESLRNISNHKLGQALRRANIAAAICCSRKGANPPTISEVSNFDL